MPISCYSLWMLCVFPFAGEEKMLELRHEKEEMDKKFRDERYTSDNIITGKGEFSSSNQR